MLIFFFEVVVVDGVYYADDGVDGVDLDHETLTKAVCRLSGLAKWICQTFCLARWHFERRKHFNKDQRKQIKQLS